MKPASRNLGVLRGAFACVGRSLRSAPATAACAAALTVGYALCAGAWLAARWRAGAADWPALSDTKMSCAAALLGAAAPLGAAWLLVSAFRRGPGDGMARRGVAAGAGLLVLLALSASAWQWLALARAGVGVWQPRTSLFSSADLGYLHAVKARLKQLQADLERQRDASVGDASAEAEARLRLVGALQAHLVRWTEREVGHWLYDTDQRRSLLALTAFHIHPGSQSQAFIRQRVAQEREELARRRGWLLVLRDYCAGRLAQQPPRAAPAAPAGEPATRAAAADQAALGELQQRLDQLGAGDWSLALAVAHDAADGTMLAEYLHQIDLSVGQMAARLAFVAESLEPMCRTPAAPGFNQRYAWLHLPVAFPSARVWAAGFVRLTLMQAALLLVALVGIGALRRPRGVDPQDAPAARAVIWACTATALAAGNLALFWAC